MQPIPRRSSRGAFGCGRARDCGGLSASENSRSARAPRRYGAQEADYCVQVIATIGITRNDQDPGWAGHQCCGRCSGCDREAICHCSGRAKSRRAAEWHHASEHIETVRRLKTANYMNNNSEPGIEYISVPQLPHDLTKEVNEAIRLFSVSMVVSDEEERDGVRSHT